MSNWLPADNIELDIRRLAAIVDSSDDAIIGKTLDGIITSWNKGAERIFGFSAEEAIGRPKTIVFPPDRYAEEDQILAQLRRGERIDHFETIRMRKNGELIDVSLTISPIRDSNSRIVGASTILRDITEVNRQKRELDKLNSRLRRSIMETHHRVKNNLQLISALIEIHCQSDRDAIPKSEVVQLGQQIHALGLIHELLISGAHGGCDAAQVSVNEVFAKLVPIIQATLGGRCIVASIDTLSVSGNQATAVALIANELIFNAVKHGKGDIELTLRTAGAGVTLEVCDSGPGFRLGFDPETDAHMGLELVEGIARTDLGAVTSYSNRSDGGALVTISFEV